MLRAFRLSAFAFYLIFYYMFLYYSERTKNNKNSKIIEFQVLVKLHTKAHLKRSLPAFVKRKTREKQCK